MEEGVVMVDTVHGAEVIVGDVSVDPSSNITRVGVTIMVDILCALIDGIAKQGAAPVALLFIEACEVVVLGDALVV